MPGKKKRERQERISRRGEFGRGIGAHMPLQQRSREKQKKNSSDRMENFSQREKEREGGDMEKHSEQTVNCKVS